MSDRLLARESHLRRARYVGHNLVIGICVIELRRRAGGSDDDRGARAIDRP